MKSINNKTDTMTEAEEKEILNSEEITDEVIRYVVDTIARTLNPEKVIIFGSAANGVPARAHDLDVLVVMDTDEPVYGRGDIVNEVLWDRSFSLDAHVITPEEYEYLLEVKDPFWGGVITSGKTLYERKPD